MTKRNSVLTVGLLVNDDNRVSSTIGSFVVFTEVTEFLGHCFRPRSKSLDKSLVVSSERSNRGGPSSQTTSLRNLMWNRKTRRPVFYSNGKLLSRQGSRCRRRRPDFFPSVFFSPKYEASFPDFTVLVHSEISFNSHPDRFSHASRDEWDTGGVRTH